MVLVYPESTGSLINEVRYSGYSNFRRLASLQKVATLDSKYIFLENVRKVFSIFTEFIPERLCEEAVYYLDKLPKVIYGLSNEENVLIYCFAAVDLTQRSKGRFLRKEIIDEILEIYSISSLNTFSREIKKAKSIIIGVYPELRRRNRSKETLMIIRGEAISIAMENQMAHTIPNINSLCEKMAACKRPWRNLELLGLAVFIESVETIRKQILSKYDREKRKKIYNACYRVRRAIDGIK